MKHISEARRPAEAGVYTPLAFCEKSVRNVLSSNIWFDIPEFELE